MRELTVTYKIFTFDELTQKAKQKAIDDYMKENDFEHIHNDVEKSIDAMIKEFKLTISDWDYGCGEPSIVGDISSKYDIVDDETEENFVSHIKKISSCWADYPLTGCCYDEHLLKPIFEDLENRKNATVDYTYEAIEKGMKNLFKKALEEIESHAEEEYFAEEAKYNEWEFYEDGRMV